MNQHIKMLLTSSAKEISLVLSKSSRVVQEEGIGRFLVKILHRILPYPFLRIISVGQELIKKPILGYFFNSSIILIVDNLINVEGNKFYEGGGEKYALTLAKTLREMGKIIIIQRAKKDFQKTFEDMLIIGLNIPRDTIGDLQFNIRTYKLLKNSGAKLYIYSPFSLAYPYVLKPAIGVSHGIYWDFSWQKDAKWSNKVIRGLSFRQIMFALKNLDKIVANDTNLLNWFRAKVPEHATLINKKVTFIPNFVDLSVFREIGKYSKKTNLTILYPRRISKERGIYLALNLARIICDKYKNVVFQFVGVGEERDIIRNMVLCEKLSDRVRIYSVGYNEMASIYNQADIAIFPSLGAEGTSLACLEAMACGCVVVASSVGGLPNLIIDGYNGLLANPTVDDFVNAIELLINNTSLRQSIRRNTLNVISVFDISRWENRFKQIVHDFMEIT